MQALRKLNSYWSPLSSLRCLFSTSPTSDLLVEILDGDSKGVAVLSINRPQFRNAISRNLLYMVDENLQSLRFNSEVRAIILRSAVSGIFCAGADLKERAVMKPEDVGPMVARARRIFSDFGNMPMPTIVALDGGAYGGGLEISMAADIRVAANDAKMGLTETRLAIIPGGGGTQRLPRLVGIGKAKELIYTAKICTGIEAEKIGLVQHAVPQNTDGDAAYQKALEIAQQIAKKGPVAVSMAKFSIDNGMQTDINTAMKIEESCYSQVIPTEDRVEALNAFLEKRKPVFKGK